MNNLKEICLLVFVSVVCAVCLSSCSKQILNTNSVLETNQSFTNSNSNSDVHAFNATEFQRNKDLWKQQNIENYKMIVEARGWMINFPDEVLIEVESGRAKSVKQISRENREIGDVYKSFDNVEKIFALIEREKKAKAEVINVYYDKTLGYPLEVIVDESIGGADDEISVKIKNLEVIKKNGNQL